MSKEQTPIDEFLENELTEMYHNKEMSYDTYSRLHDLISIASEKEVNAKVLEALESKCIEFADLCIYKRTPREQIRSEFDKWKQK